MFNNILRGIADAPNYMVIITDSLGRIEWVNQGFTRLTGYELPEVAGQTPGSLLQGPLTDQSIVAKIGQELRCGNAVSNIKLVNYTKAGVPYWVQMEITPILDNTKNISGFFAIQFEVSKFQEESASEALFFEIIERMNCCVIICDQQTSISYVNRKFTNLFGGNRASYKGQAIKNLYFSMGCPRDQIRKLSNVFDKRAHVEDLELVKFDIEGKKRFFEVEIFPRQNSLDGSNGYIIIEKDVTAEKLLAQSLRESEFRFRVLAETIPGMAYQWRVDPDGTQGYNWVSPRSIDIFGVDPADLILNWSLVGIHPEDSQRWQDSIQISIAEMSEWSFLGRYIPPDQRPRWIHCVSRPVRQLDGSIIFYGVGIDVSKQRDLEQRILQAAAEEARANAANKAKSDFLALISHELRTPLNAIRNYTTLIREELEDIGHLTLQNDLNKISFANDHLLSIITNVLDLSKIEAGKLELLIEEVHIVKFVASLVELIQPLCEENANLFETSFDLARETAMFDQTHIRQALMNLLGNAAKFTRNGRISLRVSDTHNMLVFEVEDTGIGMTNEQMMRLFQPFSQADPTISRNFGGTGLGLTLSKYFVSAMGGEIDVHSILGHGSRFTVRIPQPA